MRLTFCLPEISTFPTGGYKIIFEYANRLSQRGHEVSLVFLTHNVLSRVTKNKTIQSLVGKFRGRNQPSWFSLDKSIKKITTPYLDGREFPEADFIFATAVTTAGIVKDLPETCGRKCYFIQDFETWLLEKEAVIKTYDYGFLNFTVSQWLQRIVSAHTKNPTFCLSNPIDTDIFQVLEPIENRNPLTLGMLYHEGKHKGIPHAMKAIELVKQTYPDLVVNTFGVPERPAFLPDYYRYTQKASQKELQTLYNETAIFVCATIDEGFGLTGAESMACGCALASTAYSGVFEYAKDRENALLSPVGDSKSLAKNILSLIQDQTLRVTLAYQGSHDMKKRSWETVLDQFEGILVEESHLE